MRLKAILVTCALVRLLCHGVVSATETVTYLHTDMAGSPVAATDASGSVIWRQSYRPHGERINSQSASNSNRQFFHNKAFDQDSGLSYFGARYYDPIVGRFMAVDPKGFDEKNIHSFNRYTYGNNNPYKYKDPNGKWAVPVLAGVALWLGTEVLLQPSVPYDSGIVHSTTLPDASGLLLKGAAALGLAAKAGHTAARGLTGFTAREAAVIAEARGVLSSAELATLQVAHAAGRSASVTIGGRTILYEPGLSASGMTLFGENGFVMGQGAFASSGELGRTVLHELHRLSHSASAGGVSGALAAQEAAAAGFAERAAALLGL